MEEFDWITQRDALYKDGIGYLNTLERHLVKPSRFDNKLLFNIVVMSYEKIFSALLAHYETEAMHHTQVAMFKEASVFDHGLTEDMRETAKFIQSFESICSFDSKGYTTPPDAELKRILLGLIEIRPHTDKVFGLQ